MDKLSQKNTVLKYMQERGSITPREALDNIGSFRLGARIFDLKGEGHDIINLNKTGGERFAKYQLVTGSVLKPVKPLKEDSTNITLNTFSTTYTTQHGCFSCCEYYGAAENGKKCKIC